MWANVPLTLNVVHVIVPILLNVPAKNTAVLLQVKVNEEKSIVPEVCVYVDTLRAPDSVVVPAPLLTTNVDIVFPLGIIAPVPTVLILKLVYVPPDASVKLLIFTVEEAGVHVLPVKSNLLIQLPVVKVGIEAPDMIDIFGAVVELPTELPTVKVLVTDIVEVKAPVPV